MLDQIFLYSMGAYFSDGRHRYNAYKRTSDHEDYMLGGRNLPPWLLH